MTGVFISCRQEDAGASAIALRNDLASVFGDEHVVLHKGPPPVGNWREQIRGELGKCKVVLVVIGSRWLTISDEENRPRIQLGDDLHHQEIAFFLDQSSVTVIPVVVRKN